MFYLFDKEVSLKNSYSWKNINSQSAFSVLCLAVDERCDMELDETDPTVWLKLESAVDEYIQKNHEAFENVCERLLLPFQHEDKWSENQRSKVPTTKESNEGIAADMFSILQNITIVDP